MGQHKITQLVLLIEQQIHLIRCCSFEGGDTVKQNWTHQIYLKALYLEARINISWDDACNVLVLVMYYRHCKKCSHEGQVQKRD